MSKNSKYQTHKKSIKLTKKPNDRTGEPGTNARAKRGTLSHFLTCILAKHQKIEGVKKILEKSQNRKNSSVSPGMVCYAEKEEKRFWFSSLGQMIQFGTIKFRRTFNYFGQVVWIEKSHYDSLISLHEAPTKN